MSNAPEVRTFGGTPRTAALWQPWIAAALLGTNKGVPWGLNMETKRWYCPDVMQLRMKQEPWYGEVRERPSVLNGQTFRLDGVRDAGKSVLAKYLVHMYSGTQAGVNPDTGRPIPFRTLGFDGKPDEGEPEMQKTFDAIGGVIFDPVANGQRINYHDPLTNDEVSLVDASFDAAQLVLGRDIDVMEGLALMVATIKMYRDFPKLCSTDYLDVVLGKLDLSDVEKYNAAKEKSFSERALELFSDDAVLMRRLEAQRQRPMNIHESEFTAAASRMAAVITRFTGPEFGNAFGTGMSLSTLFGHRAMLVNRGNMSLKTREAFDVGWNRTLIHLMNSGQGHLLPHLMINEEVQTYFNSLPYLRGVDNRSRISRAFSMIDAGITQYGKQIRNVGDPDSDLRRLSESIHMGIAIRAMFAQPYDPEVLDYLVKYVGLSDLDAHLTTGLPQGCYALKLGHEPVLWLQNIVPECILGRSETNSAVRKAGRRVNVFDLEDVRTRALEAEKRYRETKGRETSDEASTA